MYLIAPHDLIGIDGLGVPRKVRAGSPIPAGLKVGEIAARTPPPEVRLLEQRRLAREAAAATSTPATRRRKKAG